MNYHMYIGLLSIIIQKSSCARQPSRMKELFEAGCQMKVLRPKKSGFPSMHAKTLIFDGRVVLTGSVNLSHNGLENNKEHLWRITEASAVHDVMDDFEQTWLVSEPVTREVVLSAISKLDEKKEERNALRNKPSRSVSRSLSKDLDDVETSAPRTSTTRNFVGTE